MDRQTKELGELKDTAGDAAARFGELAERWMADESGPDEEVWPELEETLDRPRYRELFPDARAPQA